MPREVFVSVAKLCATKIQHEDDHGPQTHRPTASAGSALTPDPRGRRSPYGASQGLMLGLSRLPKIRCEGSASIAIAPFIIRW
jgi:hypothetical protein